MSRKGFGGRYQKPVNRICQFCNKNFQTTWPRGHFCSLSCRRKAKYRRLWDVSKHPRNQYASWGASGELLVCSDLLGLGIIAYRAVTPAAPIDIIAITPNKQVHRIEVKRGRMSTNKNLIAVGRLKSEQMKQADVLAVVSRGQVFYFRPKQCGCFNIKKDKYYAW